MLFATNWLWVNDQGDMCAELEPSHLNQLEPNAPGIFALINCTDLKSEMIRRGLETSELKDHPKQNHIFMSHPMTNSMLDQPIVWLERWV